MSDIPDRVNLETNEYYRNLRDTTETEDCIAHSADVCLSLMDLFDNNRFDLKQTEAERIQRQLVHLYEYLLTRVKDNER